MRAAIRLLTMLCLLWCGLHVAEPAAAQAESAAAVVTLDGAAPADPCDDGQGRAGPAGHHHCPIAPDQRVPATVPVPKVAISKPTALRIATLTSLTRAPPLQPPAA